MNSRLMLQKSIEEDQDGEDTNEEDTPDG